FRGLPGRWFWRLSFFVPFLLASPVASQFWVWMYNPQLGLINTVLGWFGITGPAWLQDPNLAMISVVVMTVWWTVGFNFLLYLTALQNIPDHLYEAASQRWSGMRSEEHTSELQSRFDLVCRLLLEKKKHS